MFPTRELLFNVPAKSEKVRRRGNLCAVSIMT